MPQVDIKLTSTADTSGAEKMKGSLDGVGGSAKNAASGAGMFAGKMGEASVKAAAGKDVLEGLSMAAKGGEQSFFGATKALGSFMAIMNSGPIMGVVSALGLALAAFKLFSDRVIEATEKYRHFGEEINGTKEEYAALAAAAAKSLDEQIGKIKEATSALKEYSDSAERAANRAKEIEEASARLVAAKLSEAEQGELAKAKTPEERSAIKARYDEKRSETKAQTEKKNLLNDRLASELENKKYQERLDEISGIRTSADADVAVKQKAFDDWSSTASEYLKTYGLGSPQHSRALKNANMAKAELDASKRSMDAIYEKSAPEISGIEAKIYKNKARIEASNRNQEALEIERRVAVKDKQLSAASSSVSITDRQKELISARASAGEAGDWAAQDAAARELEKLRIAVSRGQYKVIEGVRMVTDEVVKGNEQTDREIKKVKDQTKAMAQRSAGQ